MCSIFLLLYWLHVLWVYVDVEDVICGKWKMNLLLVVNIDKLKK